MHHCPLCIDESERIELQDALIRVLDVQETPLPLETLAEGAPEARRPAVVDVDARIKLSSRKREEKRETYCAHPREVKNCFVQSRLAVSMYHGPP
jgi:hypothetical protein